MLHTWTQDLRTHLHVHALMACGALGRDEQGRAIWQPPRRSPTFLFPVQALSKVFKGKFLATLAPAQASDKLRLDPQPTPCERAQRTQTLRSKDWVVYAKTALAGPAAVLDYLSRHTHRTAIGNERLLGIEGDAVRFRTRVNVKRSKGEDPSAQSSRLTTLPGVEFIGRFLHHIVPSGFKRIRHCGLLAPAAKAQRMASARALLAMPQANPPATEAVRDFMQRVARMDI